LPDRLIEQSMSWSAIKVRNCSLLYWADSNGPRNIYIEGGCDGHSKAPITQFWTSAIAVTGTAASGGAI
jgi:hypothetical protein